jgi:hypothetical protein
VKYRGCGGKTLVSSIFFVQIGYSSLGLLPEGDIQKFPTFMEIGNYSQRSEKRAKGILHNPFY